MIFTPILLLGGAIMQLFSYILATLQWNFPGSIINAINVFLTVLSYFAPFLPFIGTIIAIAIIVVPAHVLRYAFNIILWLWSLVPWIGTRTSIPDSNITTTRNWGSKTWDSRIEKKTVRDSIKVKGGYWKRFDN